MKHTFLHTLVNGPFEDPVLFIRIMWEKRALMFDIGNISRLDPGDLHKITDVFVTHTHIDHFIGLDSIIRALLRRETPLRIYGPSNIADCVEGKLKGYTWNLIEEYPMKIEVYAVDGDRILPSNFHAADRFLRRDKSIRNFSGILLQEPLFRVRAVQLDHQVPCLAFSVEEEIHINIDKVSLGEKGLPVGPWLSELKKAIRGKMPRDAKIVVSGRKYKLGELSGIYKITKGQKISYVTDVSASDANIDKIIGLVSGSDTLYCEAYFLHKDLDRALKRFHLTAKLAGMIARQAGVGNLSVMHFSPKYRGFDETPEVEAMEEFRREVY
jgi:ribonuclease Z